MGCRCCCIPQVGCCCCIPQLGCGRWQSGGGGQASTGFGRRQTGLGLHRGGGFPHVCCGKHRGGSGTGPHLGGTLKRFAPGTETKKMRSRLLAGCSGRREFRINCTFERSDLFKVCYGRWKLPETSSADHHAVYVCLAVTCIQAAARRRCGTGWWGAASGLRWRAFRLLWLAPLLLLLALIAPGRKRVIIQKS